MECPSCGSPDVAWSGTTFKGKKYDKACNKCGYVWDKINKKCDNCIHRNHMFCLGYKMRLCDLILITENCKRFKE